MKRRGKKHEGEVLKKQKMSRDRGAGMTIEACEKQMQDCESTITKKKKKKKYYHTMIVQREGSICVCLFVCLFVVCFCWGRGHTVFVQTKILSEGCYQYSKMFHWVPEGCYHCTPFWFSINPKNPPPLDVSRDNFVEIFFHATSFHDFFLSSLAQLLALFSEKSGVRFQSYATLCNRPSAQNLKIFWICVQNIWKMASCAKTPLWALKCSICFHYS